MTLRLYWDDAYAGKAAVEVIDVRAEGLVLDRTVFHVRGGGQPGDTGTIGPDRIIDTRAGEDGAVVHVTQGPPRGRPGDELPATVDWERRYALMRHHSLLHLVHLVVLHQLGHVRDLGSEVGTARARIEYSHPGDFDIEKIATAVLDLIASDLPATTATHSDGGRVWSIPGWPEIPCGGTHVSHLAEIGDAAMRKKSAGRRGVRLYAAAVVQPNFDVPGMVSYGG